MYPQLLLLQYSTVIGLTVDWPASHYLYFTLRSLPMSVYCLLGVQCNNIVDRCRSVYEQATQHENITMKARNNRSSEQEKVIEAKKKKMNR